MYKCPKCHRGYMYWNGKMNTGFDFMYQCNNLFCNYEISSTEWERINKNRTEVTGKHD